MEITFSKSFKAQEYKLLAKLKEHVKMPLVLLGLLTENSKYALTNNTVGNAKLVSLQAFLFLLNKVRVLLINCYTT